VEELLGDDADRDAERRRRGSDRLRASRIDAVTRDVAGRGAGEIARTRLVERALVHVGVDTVREGETAARRIIRVVAVIHEDLEDLGIPGGVQVRLTRVIDAPATNAAEQNHPGKQAMSYTQPNGHFVPLLFSDLRSSSPPGLDCARFTNFL